MCKGQVVDNLQSQRPPCEPCRTLATTSQGTASLMLLVRQFDNWVGFFFLLLLPLSLLPPGFRQTAVHCEVKHLPPFFIGFYFHCSRSHLTIIETCDTAFSHRRHYVKTCSHLQKVLQKLSMQKCVVRMADLPYWLLATLQYCL